MLHTGIAEIGPQYADRKKVKEAVESGDNEALLDTAAEEIRLLPPYGPTPSTGEFVKAYQYVASTRGRKERLVDDPVYDFLAKVAAFANVRDVSEFFDHTIQHADLDIQGPLDSGELETEEIAKAAKKARLYVRAVEVSEGYDMLLAQSRLTGGGTQATSGAATAARRALLDQGALQESGDAVYTDENDKEVVLGTPGLILRVEDPSKVVSRETMRWSVETMRLRTKRDIAMQEYQAVLPSERRRRIYETARFLDRRENDGWAALKPKIYGHIDEALELVRGFCPHLRDLESARPIVNNWQPRGARTRFAKLVAHQIGESAYLHPSRHLLEKTHARLVLLSNRLLQYFFNYRLVRDNDGMKLVEAWEGHSEIAGPEDFAFA